MAQARAAADQAAALGRAKVRPGPTNVHRVSGDGFVPIVGESHYQEVLYIAANGRAHATEPADHSVIDVALVPEPGNPHDRFAVRIDALLPGEGQATIGYLARELARQYQPVLRAGTRPGATAVCAGRIAGGGPKYYGAWLHLAPPESLFLANEPPHDAQLLASERQVTVTGEERHQDSLSHHGVTAGELRRLYATLDGGVITKGKYAGQPCVQVSIGGEAVGELTFAQSQNYLPLVQAVRQQGRLVACEALLADSPKGVQVELRLPRV